MDYYTLGSTDCQVLPFGFPRDLRVWMFSMHGESDLPDPTSTVYQGLLLEDRVGKLRHQEE